MDVKLMESYLDTIAEQIVDEDKIVTYKSLSRSLKIHVNTAKQLLYAYLIKERSKNSFPISATYLVAGKVVDGSFNIAIVNEADLKNSYANFLEITSEHVYSVQKGQGLKDLRMLCETDKESLNMKSSNLVIKCSKGIKKLKHEVKKKSKSHEEQNQKVITNALVSEKQIVDEAESSKKNERTANKVVKETPKNSSTKENSEKSHTNVKKPAGTIASLFAKAAQKNSEKTIASAKNDKKLQNEPMEVDGNIENVDLLVSDEEISERGNESKKSLKRKKKGNKRKRIQMFSDSDESGSGDDVIEERPQVDAEEDQDQISCIQILEEEEEEEEKIKEITPRNKKKKRKLIDRTVMNEEGYLETKKEVVFETDSESEPEQIEVKSKEETRKTKINNVKGAGTAKKQASLLTFFKKT